MEFYRKISAVFLCLLLLVPVSAGAADTEQEQAIVRDLIAYYFHFRDEAAGEIDNQLETLSSLDAREGALWKQIMTEWAWINGQMEVFMGQLPQGLPEDDSLCIVVLGYGLNSDGSMKQELLDRLEVALTCAEQYPRSYVLCTGGETSRVPGVTEAGQMGDWLLAKGLSGSRLIMENESLSTTDNARNSLTLLWRDYPQVSTLVIVSSDYHIRWGSAVFSAMAAIGAVRQGKPQLTLAGNAACETESPDRDTVYSQAWGISILAGVPFDGSYVPTLYMTAPGSVEQTLPVTETTVPEEPVQAQPHKREPVAAVLLGLCGAVAVIFLPKRKKSGSD